MTRHRPVTVTLLAAAQNLVMSAQPLVKVEGFPQAILPPAHRVRPILEVIPFWQREMSTILRRKDLHVQTLEHAPTYAAEVTQ